jgi:hypothetical protein
MADLKIKSLRIQQLVFSQEQSQRFIECWNQRIECSDTHESIATTSDDDDADDDHEEDAISNTPPQTTVGGKPKPILTEQECLQCEAHPWYEIFHTYESLDHGVPYKRKSETTLIIRHHGYKTFAFIDANQTILFIHINLNNQDEENKWCPFTLELQQRKEPNLKTLTIPPTSPTFHPQCGIEYEEKYIYHECVDNDLENLYARLLNYQARQASICYTMGIPVTRKRDT